MHVAICRSHSRKRSRHSNRAPASGAAERMLDEDDIYMPPTSRVCYPCALGGMLQSETARP